MVEKQKNYPVVTMECGEKLSVERRETLSIAPEVSKSFLRKALKEAGVRVRLAREREGHSRQREQHQQGRGTDAMKMGRPARTRLGHAKKF